MLAVGSVSRVPAIETGRAALDLKSCALLMIHQPFPTKLASFRKKLRPVRVVRSVCRVLDRRSNGPWVCLSSFSIRGPAAGAFVYRFLPILDP